MKHDSNRQVGVRRWGPVAASVVVLAIGNAGCDYDEGSGRAPGDALPDRVEVAGAKMVLGHSAGRIREEATVKSFQISKHPVTVGEYRRCVELNGCAPIEEVESPNVWKGTYKAGGEHGSAPLVGVSVQEARAYCKWVGGRLPTYPEWQLAARGPEVKPYAWGDAPVTCERHAFVAEEDGQALGCCDEECATPKVGMRSAGASPSGVEDVMLVPGGELIGKGGEDSGARSMRCRSEACVVKSSVRGRPTADAVVAATGDEAFGFRCVWES